MAVPTFEQMLRPILAESSRRNITRKDVTPTIEDYFNLTSEERLEKIQAGATKVRNRVGWAMTFLTKGGLISKVAPRVYQITDFGHGFLAKYPETITVKDLETIPNWKEAWNNGKEEVDSTSVNEAVTPAESLNAAVETLNTDLKQRLLQSILDQTPEFFEQLVLDVLVAMGYGGLRADAAERLGRSGDEGVDGRINQDPLGLDQIFVQAKRYAPERPIDRQTIQAFVGSMTGQGATKGVFITTSKFNENAREFVLRGSNTKVVLIDGAQLLSLMLQHKIGVRVQKTIELMELDQNYFEDEE